MAGRSGSAHKANMLHNPTYMIPRSDRAQSSAGKLRCIARPDALKLKQCKRGAPGVEDAQQQQAGAK